jgi:hypothetical protein
MVLRALAASCIENGAEPMAKIRSTTSLRSFIGYAHVQHEDEYGIEDGVEDRADQHRPHGHLRVAFTPDEIVHAESDAVEHHAEEYDPHVASGERQDRVAGSGEAEQRVQEGKAGDRQDGRHDDYQHERVVEDALCEILLSLPERN